MNTNMTNTVRAMAIGAAITLGFGAAAASADGFPNDQAAGAGVYKHAVRFPDLDLSKMEGASALYSRIDHAARIVCRTFESREVDVAAKFRACRDKAVANAVAGVNQPMLSEYHALRTKSNKAGPVQLARTN